VRAGAITFDNDAEAVDREVAGIYRHPGYDSDSMINDIAVLKLSSPLPLSPSSSINAACVPDGGRSAPVGTTCTIAGWGDTYDDANAGSNIALEAQIPVIGYYGDDCGNYSPLSFSPNTVCAGFTNGTKDTCQGDSGGPMTFFDQRKGAVVLLGVTSWGEGCAREGLPGFYTDVGEFRGFINSVIKRHN